MHIRESPIYIIISYSPHQLECCHKFFTNFLFRGAAGQLHNICTSVDEKVVSEPPSPGRPWFSRNSQPRSFSFPSSIITSPPRSNATLNLPGVVQDNLSGHPKKERKFRIDCEITSFRFCFVQKHVIHIHVVEAHQLDKFQTLALCKVINASSGRGTFCS